MSRGFREIEKQYRLGDTLDVFNDWFTLVNQKALLGGKVVRVLPLCETVDTYWQHPEHQDKFLRIRDSIGQTRGGEYHMLKELTVKSKDRGNNFNRFEANLGIDSASVADSLLNVWLGRSSKLGRVIKKDAIWFIQEPAGEVVVSLTLIKNDNSVFLKIGGPTEELVNRYCRDFAPSNSPIEPKSFFELYMNRGNR